MEMWSPSHMAKQGPCLCTGGCPSGLNVNKGRVGAGLQHDTRATHFGAEREEPRGHWGLHYAVQLREVGGWMQTVPIALPCRVKLQLALLGAWEDKQEEQPLVMVCDRASSQILHQILQDLALLKLRNHMRSFVP